MDPIKELNKIASEVKEFDERLASDIVDASKELDGKKTAALIEKNMRIVAVNPIQGIFKGRLYRAGDEIQPNFIEIFEDDGSKVGIFRADRFLPDWNAY